MTYCNYSTFFFFLKTGQNAWSPRNNTYYEFIDIDFDDRQNITSIGTQGFGQEFVTEYALLYSDDGVVWQTFFSSSGSAEVGDYNSACKFASLRLSLAHRSACFLAAFILKLGTLLCLFNLLIFQFV